MQHACQIHQAIDIHTNSNFCDSQTRSKVRILLTFTTPDSTVRLLIIELQKKMAPTEPFNKTNCSQQISEAIAPVITFATPVDTRDDQTDNQTTQ